MSYASLAHLTDRFGAEMLVGLTDRAVPPAGVVDGTVVDRALADTDALIDGYLAARYVLPLATTPALLVDIAQAIAIWKLHTFKPDEKIEADYREALRQLQQIATGTIRLSIAGIEPATDDGGGAMITDRERPMTEQNLRGFI